MHKSEEAPHCQLLSFFGDRHTKQNSCWHFTHFICLQPAICSISVVHFGQALHSGTFTAGPIVIFLQFLSIFSSSVDTHRKFSHSKLHFFKHILQNSYPLLEFEHTLHETRLTSSGFIPMLLKQGQAFITMLLQQGQAFASSFSLRKIAEKLFSNKSFSSLVKTHIFLHNPKLHTFLQIVLSLSIPGHSIKTFFCGIKFLR